MKIPLRFILGVSLLCLCACGERAARIEPVEVNIPLPVSCTAGKIEQPKWNVPDLSAAATEAEKLKAALADLELSRGYIEELKAALAACG